MMMPAFRLSVAVWANSVATSFIGLPSSQAAIAAVAFRAIVFSCSKFLPLKHSSRFRFVYFLSSNGKIYSSPASGVL